ncbi:hypothetical protein [Streptomyces sp. NPDC002057]|uniref:hypothetical protein n=1 Tax=Streptomyces sp. NPDC002057 TaxID=3154664 RepID=UPI00332F8AA4
MYGPPQAPQVPQPPKSPASGGLIALRVLLSALALLSCGFLGWAPLLRLAVVTRRTRDWVLCGLVFLASAGLFAYAAATGDEETGTAESFIGIGLIVLLVAGPITYYLVAEIRHFERQRTRPPQQPLGYGYATAVTTPSGLPPRNPYATEPPAVPGPGAPRIDQVRAELDELSDLLRKEPREGEGGR